ALDETAAAKGHIEQAQDVHARQRQYPVAVTVELAGSVHAADQRAHRTASDGADVETVRHQFLDHADMRLAARATGSENEGYRHARCRYPDIAGGRIAHAAEPPW